MILLEELVIFAYDHNKFNSYILNLYLLSLILKDVLMMHISFKKVKR